MSEEKQILKNSKKSMLDVDEDVLLTLDLSNNERKLSGSDVSSSLDQYRQYVKENDASKKYRFVFTINPVCSNVLYNHITEIISEDTKGIEFYGADGVSVSSQYNKYVEYKYGANTSKKLKRSDLIKDTGYSHKECGNFKYYCGIDIFNNHRFRSDDFVTVNNKKEGETCTTYNTISDLLRECDGTTLKTVTKVFPVESGKNAKKININFDIDDKNRWDFSKPIENETDTHLYFKNTFKSFSNSIQDNLLEKNGWFGFINPTSLDMVNFKHGDLELSINKVINNEDGCKFVDLYPDRTTFSFIPVRNNKLKRDEKNWDYCITYPYENYIDNELVSLFDKDNNIVANGLLAEFCDDSGKRINDFNTLINGDGIDEFFDIIGHTKIRNNINPGDNLTIHLVCSGNSNIVYATIKNTVRVKSTGIGGYGQSYYFTLRSTDMASGLKTLKNKAGANGLDLENLNIYFYVQRIANGRPCKYYFRKFKRLPNFKNTQISNINSVSKEDIDKYCFNDFNSSLNRLGFGRNIYGDKMAQIVFNDDVDVTGLYDNLGRELHEVFLTFIKTNRGHNEWYNRLFSISPTRVEISHCFGDICSGIDMPWVFDSEYNQQDKFNVHKIHNVDHELFPATVERLENNINCSGTSLTEERGVFLGDIVELDEESVQEYILESVQHRFNTVQREINSGEFSGLTFDEIKYDDYDYSGFTVETKQLLKEGCPANLAPEGYYYKAHYIIPIREFSDTVYEGQHTIVSFDTIETSDDIATATTDRNYFFNVSDEIYIYDKETKEKHIGVITSVSGDDFRNIQFTTDGIDFSMDNVYDYSFYKPNKLKPSTAYDFDDGSGIYKWREFNSCEMISPDSELYDMVFTNGAHYIHKNINFFLRRQDPNGFFGLNYFTNETLQNADSNYLLLEQGGLEKDVSQGAYFNGDFTLC